MRAVPGGLGFMHPAHPLYQQLNAGNAIAGATQKAAYIFRVKTPDGLARTLKGVGLRFGTVTKAGASVLTMDIQGVAAASGFPAQPDGTSKIGGVLTIANANSKWLSNTWMSTSADVGAFASNLSVNHGDFLAIVFAYSSFGGADTTNFNGQSAAGAFQTGGISATYNGSVWANSGLGLAGVLEFTDGSFGPIGEFAGYSAYNTVAFASGTEAGNSWTLPFPVLVTGLRFMALVNTGITYTIKLYLDNSTAATTTITWKGDYGRDAAQRVYEALFPVTTYIRAGQQFRITISPSSSSGSYYTVDTPSNAVNAACGGTTHYHSTLTSGTWTDVTASRMQLNALLESVDDGLARLALLGGNLA